MTNAVVKSALARARTVFRKTNPKSLSAKRLDDLLAEIRPGAANTGLTEDEKLSFWRGIGRLVDGDPAPSTGKINTILRRYVTAKNDRWLLWALGECEDIPRDRMSVAFGSGGSWRQDVPKLLAERLVNEEKWNKLLSKVNTKLRGELSYWRGDNRAMRNRYNTFNSYDPSMQGPTTPPPPRGPSLNDLGFATGDSRGAMAQLGWRTAGLLGWGDVNNPVTRTISNLFPDPGPAAGRPRGVEGWITLGHGPRSAAADRLQKEVVRDFLDAHPHHRTSWNTERQVVRNYDFDSERYIDVDAPDPLDFDNPLHDQYWSWPKWHGSHLGAHSLGFDTNLDNVIALPARINTSYMAYYEEILRDLYRRFDGKLYLRVEVIDYDIHGLAKAVRYEAFTPDANGTPIRVMSESFVTNYNPTVTRAQKALESEEAWRVHDKWRDAGEP